MHIKCLYKSEKECEVYFLWVFGFPYASSQKSEVIMTSWLYSYPHWKFFDLFLGDNESGKTTLIAKLQGVEDPKKGSGLEFAYIDVRDDYRDGRFTISFFFFF